MKLRWLLPHAAKRRAKNEKSEVKLEHKRAASILTHRRELAFPQTRGSCIDRLDSGWDPSRFGPFSDVRFVAMTP